MDESIRGTSRSKFWTIICFVLIPILVGSGLLAQQLALATVRDIRKLERIPLSPINVALPGPVRTTGKVEQLPGTTLLSSKWTNTPCVWYRAVKEVEKRDSDGNTSWSTVLSETRAIDFLLEDETGTVQVARSDSADFEIGRSWRRTRGKERFTEYRIVLNERLYVVGFLVSNDMRPRIVFDEPGEYVPIISEDPIAGSRASRAVLATTGIIASLFLVSAACVCLALAFRLHNALGFVTVVGLIEVLFLVVGGIFMMTSDLAAAQESLETQEHAAQVIVTNGFKQLDIDYDGSWTDEAAFKAADAKGPVGTRLVAMRRDLAARVARTSDVRERFPQSVVAWAMGLNPTPKVLGPGEELQMSDATIKPAIPSLVWPLIIIPTSAAVAILGLLVGFKKIKLKRLIENVPTTPAAEVEIGITEIKGTVGSCDDIEPLTGPLTEKPCVWFRYLVQEWRGSGKNRHLVTIEDRKRGQVFLCNDVSGSIPVVTHEARVVSGRKAGRSKGIRVYSEFSLRPGDPVYVLGSAEIDPVTGDSLRIEKDPQGLPYLVSNLPERRLKTREIVGAFWCFAFGIASTAAFILGLLLFTGRIAAVDQLLAALASIAMIALIVTMIMYNDLVFLRQRVAWARSNIDVALKKRFDLLPQLEAIAKGYMKHEHEVLPLLTKLRSAWSMKGVEANTAGESVSASNTATSGLLALREQYPNLKAVTTTERLMRGIVALENEIAARRDGYNAAVERYRSRTHAMPEIALAKVFAFREEPLLRWESEIRDLDPLDFEHAERTDLDLGKEDEPE